MQFLTSGFDSAKARARNTTARNKDFADRVLATTSQLAAPEVYAAALFAVEGNDSDRAWFVRTGYAAAKQRDRVAREADGTQAAALMDFDRKFIVDRRDDDPGEQVRVSAAWALRDGATDADVVDFYAHGWLNAASLDLEVHRLRLADAEVAWRKNIEQLAIDARAAEKAANEAADEAAVQAREKAARAWQDVLGKAGPASSAWSNAETDAREQAENWRTVLQAALAAGGPNWDPIVAPATANQEQWANELDTAVGLASFWTALYTEALAGETRMTTGG